MARQVTSTLRPHSSANCYERGELSDEDHRENLYSVSRQLRIFSAFKTKQDVKLWVITEADRSATTILLPSEY
jgi:hypothetical protein